MQLPSLSQLCGWFRGSGRSGAFIGMKRVAGAALTALPCLGLAAAAEGPQPGPLDWPAITREHRPWAYNWWHGSAVDPTNLTRELRRYREGGLGGIHIIPIYGTQGAEAREIEYLSPRWMEMMRHTVSEAQRLDLGVDMTTGSGWCFGGPQVPRELGGWRMQTRIFDVAAGGRLSERFDRRTLQALVAVNAAGRRVDLREKIDERGFLAWEAGQEAWKTYALIAAPGGPAVKRPAPGGAGPMINTLDPEAMRRFLDRFTGAFAGYQGPKPRSMYHDSYEYNSTWAPGLPEAFARRRGYHLEERLPEFCAPSPREDLAARVMCDFRETVSDLMIEEVFPQWARWCRERGFQTRNQAHGSPANILDLYALADIPETEMFGRGKRDPLRSRFDGAFLEGDRNVFIGKFASSAAHVMGRQRVAAETGTWMAEHFCETLEELKCLVDLLFVGGVNHVVYHGCCYSPDDAPWPGWLFYASTQMNPRNPIWRDASTLNDYIARCQSILQAGSPDNDLLLYWPIHDLWQSAPGALVNCVVHNAAWLDGQPVGRTARQLWALGHGFDYLSDRQAGLAGVEGGLIKTPGGAYRALLVPGARAMPAPTLRKLIDLARAGATVLFQDALPVDVPGAGDLEARRRKFSQLTAGLEFKPAAGDLREAKVGRGRLVAGSLGAALRHCGARRESLTDHPGAVFIRRRHAEGRHYFIANQGTNLLSGWQTLATEAAAVAILDPMTGSAAMAPIERADNGLPRVFLRLEPGHSVILRTFTRAPAAGKTWQFAEPGAAALELRGPWNVRFLEGGPTLPKPFETAALVSWTGNGDPETARFAGTAVYSTRFRAPAGQGPWMLDLGRVCHSARVRLNGKTLGVLLMSPYRMPVDNLDPQDNLLEIEVTNLAANRIRDLDRRKVPWRVFHDINLVNIGYRPFDASDWPVFESGLLGPVVLRQARLR